MARLVLNDGDTLGIQRGKLNTNFTELYSIKLESSQVLIKTNTTPYTPTTPYHPATKQYADGLYSSLVAIYDPTGVSGDAFLRSNHVGMMDALYITQSASYRFASDAEKAVWSAKEDAIGAKGTAFNKSFGTIAGSVAEGNHVHTKSQVGLGNVDNTSDVNKPVSTAQQTAINNAPNLVNGVVSAVDWNPSALTTVNVVQISNTSAPRNAIISTEDVASGSPTRLRNIIIRDTSGGAGTNNITVSLESGGLISGELTQLINSDHGSLTIQLDGTNGYIV